MAQGAQGVGLAGAGQPEGQDVDAALDEAALGQMVQFLAQRQGDPIVLEGFPGLARGQPGLPAQSGDAARSSASCSRTSRKVGKASPWPAAVKRATVSAATVGSLN